jgi:DNA polymerase-3 subunit epsilon
VQTSRRVDNSARDLHGGLIDAQLLADVYLAMTSGQVVLDLGFEGASERARSHGANAGGACTRPRVLRANDEEATAHQRRLDSLDKSAGGQSVWRRHEAEV